MKSQQQAFESEVPEGGSMYKVLRFAAENRLSDDAAVALVEKHASDFLHRLIIKAYHQVQRAITRGIEYEVDEELGDAETVEDRISARAALVTETFALKDGTVVRWGKATESQHVARAVWQRELAGHCTEDAERHETAAAEILAAGVKCLDDLKKKERR